MSQQELQPFSLLQPFWPVKFKQAGLEIATLPMSSPTVLCVIILALTMPINNQAGATFPHPEGLLHNKLGLGIYYIS
jgi:hypothetical protein